VVGTRTVFLSRRLLTAGKRFGDILDPNLTGVMYKTTSRGNWYDRCYYMPNIATHEYQYPYLSVNRRTNMASLLSEGGFHTIPMQQALNINDSYKRLEAFGTFRSILEYVGVTRPDKVMLTGVVTNSENDSLWMALLLPLLVIL
jgi:hypothetical protein